MAPIWCRRYCQRVPQPEELAGSVTIKRTSRKCNNQKHFQEVSHSKVNSAIMVTEKQFHKKCIQGVLQLKVHQGSITIKSTARECHNLSSSGSVAIKSTTRDRHNQKYCPGPPQSKLMTESAAIKYIQGIQLTEVQQESMTTRKCNMQMYFNSVPQLKHCKGVSQSKELPKRLIGMPDSITMKSTSRSVTTKKN